MLMMEKTNHIPCLSVRTAILSGVLYFTPYISFTQCITPVSGLPYNENFETSNGNWVAGGTFSDWAWGTPSKPVINAASSGSKCWITGGLNTRGYNGDQNSWLKSPCFNFTNLKHPYLKFKVFWETEGKNDGANLQYSIDNGSTWQILGNRTETTGCLSEKWYNDGPLSSIGNQDAWSGNIQSSKPGCIVSGGSAGWVTAKHSAANLSGVPNVMFRFVFASTTSCNDFDGFAIDNFTIEEAPASTASFTYNCSSNLRVNFVNRSTLCPTSFLWDFGDPASGANNTSTLPNPTHAYTTGGNYDVSLTVSGPGNTSSTFTLHKLQIIENIIASIVTPIRCYDDTTGSVTVNFTGDALGVSYSWDTDPVQATQTAVNLGAGDYNVTILNREGCPASAHVTLGEPPRMLNQVTSVKPDCSANNGRIAVAMSGGAPPYSYNWSPAVSNTASAANLRSGTYVVTVVDNNLCYKVINIDLQDAGTLTASILTTKDVSCFGGNDGMATATANGGSPPYSYAWSPMGGSLIAATNLTAGNNTIIVTDANGCKALATAIIQQPSTLMSVMKIQNTFCGNNNGIASVKVYGGTGPYQYTWSTGNYTSDSINNLAPGQHTVRIEDKNGCIKNDIAFIASSSAIQVQLLHTDVLCAGDSTGSAEAIVMGGTAPYRFEWSGSTQVWNTNPITNVTADIYNLKLQDAVGCSVNSSVLIAQPEPLKATITTQPSYCDLSNGSVSAAVSGGRSPYLFNWAPVTSTMPALANVYAGDYQLVVTDNNNCRLSITTTILNDEPQRVFLGNDTTLCPGSKMTLSPGIYNSYKWQDNSVSPDYTVTNAGMYTIEVIDNLHCVLKDTINIISDCGFIFFPNAFTPNNDLQNDLFGPAGYLNTVKDYTLLIYNRLGQLVFRSTDPFKKWDGRMQDKSRLPGTYVWIARYSNKGIANILQKGTVTVIY